MVANATVSRPGPSPELQKEIDEFNQLIRDNYENPQGILDGCKALIFNGKRLWDSDGRSISDNISRQKHIFALQFLACNALKGFLAKCYKNKRVVETRKCEQCLVKLTRLSTDHYTSAILQMFEHYGIARAIEGLFGRNHLLDNLLIRVKHSTTVPRRDVDKKSSEELMAFCTLLLHRIGDIDRYHGSLKNTGPASDQFYSAACLLMPRTGFSWNGLAILGLHSSPKFITLYRFYRAASSEISFTPAIQSYEELLKSEHKWEMSFNIDKEPYHTLCFSVHVHAWKSCLPPEGVDYKFQRVMTMVAESEQFPPNELQVLCLANIAAFYLERARHMKQGNPGRPSTIFLQLCLQTFLTLVKWQVEMIGLPCYSIRVSTALRVCSAWFSLNLDDIVEEVTKANNFSLSNLLVEVLTRLCQLATILYQRPDTRDIEVPNHLLDCDIDILGFAPLDRPANTCLWSMGKRKLYPEADYNFHNLSNEEKLARQDHLHKCYLNCVIRDVLAFVTSVTAPVEVKQANGQLHFYCTRSSFGKTLPFYPQGTFGSDLEDGDEDMNADGRPGLERLPADSPPQEQEPLPQFDLDSSQQESTTYGHLGESTVGLLAKQLNADASVPRRTQQTSQKVNTQTTEQRFFSTGPSQHKVDDSLLADVEED